MKKSSRTLINENLLRSIFTRPFKMQKYFYIHLHFTVCKQQQQHSLRELFCKQKCISINWAEVCHQIECNWMKMIELILMIQALYFSLGLTDSEQFPRRKLQRTVFLWFCWMRILKVILLTSQTYDVVVANYIYYPNINVHQCISKIIVLKCGVFIRTLKTRDFLNLKFELFLIGWTAKAFSSLHLEHPVAVRLLNKV